MEEETDQLLWFRKIVPFKVEVLLHAFNFEYTNVIRVTACFNKWLTFIDNLSFTIFVFNYVFINERETVDIVLYFEVSFSLFTVDSMLINYVFNNFYSFVVRWKVCKYLIIFVSQIKVGPIVRLRCFFILRVICWPFIEVQLKAKYLTTQKFVDRNAIFNQCNHILLKKNYWWKIVLILGDIVNDWLNCPNLVIS